MINTLTKKIVLQYLEQRNVYFKTIEKKKKKSGDAETLKNQRFLARQK